MEIKVEIWSDIVCPFCYIGKRNFEKALTQFPQADQVEIEWKSFQLDPSMPHAVDHKKNVYQYLAERKGISYESSVKMHENVVQMAKQAGLDYRFDQAKVFNSFQAHCVIQLAKTKGLGDVAEEIFFKAYFTDGKNLGDEKELIVQGKQIGLTETEVSTALTDQHYAQKVKNDIEEAGKLGLRGVPFFVFNRQYGVSGAQPSEIFLETLNKVSGF